MSYDINTQGKKKKGRKKTTRLFLYKFIMKKKVPGMKNLLQEMSLMEGEAKENGRGASTYVN